VEELTLHVYYKNGTAESVLYNDGGEGYDYQQGHQTLRRFLVSGTATALTLTQQIEGDYQPSYATYCVVLHGLPTPPQAASADGQSVVLDTHAATPGTGAAPALKVGVGFGEVRIELAAPDSVAPDRA
jgi:alpha-glucosidase